MSAEMVEEVRRFNRVVTERVGVLNDRFLGRRRPLGEARLLWEIALEGCEVRLLRARLNLDSGYLSRLLSSLEAAGLVEVTQSAADRRIRIARLWRPIINTFTTLRRAILFEQPSQTRRQSSC